MDKSENSSMVARPPRPSTAARMFWRGTIMLLVGGVLGGGGVWLALRRGGRPSQTREAALLARRLFQCPMHPTITADHPSDCPICGMKLVEVKSAPSATAPGQQLANEARSAGAPPVKGLATVTIDPSRQQLIGLRTARVLRGAVASSFRTVGRVQIDPTRVRKINIKVEGYIERMYVDFVGRPVRKGERMFSLYSPSLLAAQNEYLLALNTQEALTKHGALTGNGAALVASARRKLELLDVPAESIVQLEQTRAPTKALTFLSPIAGVVTAKNVVEGARINPGDTPYEITNLGMVWVMADAYEADLGQVRVRMPASLTLQAYPDRSFTGTVAFIDPLLDAKTRTAKVHIHFANPTGELKPEMFGEVTLAGKPREGLRIPADAVLRAGEKDVVFLALGNGKFEPRAVKLGAKRADMVEVLGGLAINQEVVTRANFLVDSESQLRSSLAAMGGK